MGVGAVRVGAGSTFEVRVPLTLAVIEGLVVRVGASVVVVPISSVTESLNVQDAEIRTSAGSRCCRCAERCCR